MKDPIFKATWDSNAPAANGVLYLGATGRTSLHLPPRWVIDSGNAAEQDWWGEALTDKVLQIPNGIYTCQAYTHEVGDGGLRVAADWASDPQVAAPDFDQYGPVLAFVTHDQTTPDGAGNAVHYGQVWVKGPNNRLIFSRSGPDPDYYRIEMMKVA